MSLSTLQFAVKNRFRHRSDAYEKREHWMDWAEEKYDVCLPSNQTLYTTHTVHWTLYTLHQALCTAHWKPYTLHNIHRTAHTLHQLYTSSIQLRNLIRHLFICPSWNKVHPHCAAHHTLPTVSTQGDVALEMTVCFCSPTETAHRSGEDGAESPVPLHPLAYVLGSLWPAGNTENVSGSYPPVAEKLGHMSLFRCIQ